VVETVTGISPGRRAVDAHPLGLDDRADPLQHDTGVERRETRAMLGVRGEEELVVVAAFEREA
jgi:hypothetical protein